MLAICLALIDEPSDKELFMELYHNHKLLMKSAAFRALNNRCLVEDAVQEALLTIASKIERFHGLSADQQAALITIITRNTAINSLDNIYSDVLMLKYVYGYDCRTISEMFHVSTRTIESRIYRGKKLLAKVVSEIQWQIGRKGLIFRNERDKGWMIMMLE